MRRSYKRAASWFDACDFYRETDEYVRVQESSSRAMCGLAWTVDQNSVIQDLEFGCNRHHQWEISGAHREMKAVPVRMVKPTVAPIASCPRT